jgi:hypothetical protein
MMKRILLAVMLLSLVPACTAMQELAALRLVTFSFNRVANVEIAGIPVGPGADYSNLGISNVARLAAAIADGRMPLELTAHVDAMNPPENKVTARMLRLAWTMFVEDRKTVSGVVADSVSIRPGTTADVPVTIELDLVPYFGGSAKELFDLAVGIAGGRGTTKEVRLELIPTIDTSLGPLSYPTPIVVTRPAD